MMALATVLRGRIRLREVFTGRRADSLTTEEVAASWGAGYEPGTDGWLVGRDPRGMTPDELEAMGHERMSPMEAIRAKCLDCVGGSSDEVRKCVAMSCPSWPSRTGKNPWRTPPSDERLEVLRQRGRRLAEARKILPADDDSPPGGSE